MNMATKAQINAFIALVAPLIQKQANSGGYKICSTVIAQACCESAYGTSTLWSKYFNAFGMKCGSSWKGKSVNMTTNEEYTVGTLTAIKDNFRVYDSAEEGIKGYYDFISASRYANLKTATTYKQYAENLKADGYATSSTYVNTLCKIVETYNLTQYDSGAVVEAAPFTVGKTYTLQGNMYVRKTANGTKKKYTELTTNAKSNAVKQSDGSAVLKKGTVVTCKGVEQVDGAWWVKIPSGYVCGIGASGTVYLK
jgi:hypothetical protein